LGSKTTRPVVILKEGYRVEPDSHIAVAGVAGSAAIVVAGTANAETKKEANEVETTTDNARVEYYAFHQGNIRRAEETG
jgi:hypothetical protein